MNNRGLADRLAERWALLDEASAKGSEVKVMAARFNLESILDNRANRDAILTALRAAPEGWRPSEEAIERAAEAAFLTCQRRTQASRDRFPWTSIDSATRGYWRDFARAALRAASEPLP